MIDLLETREWHFIRQRMSSHRIYRNNNATVVLIVVPYHKGKDPPQGTQRAIIRDAGIAPNEM